MAGEGMTRGGDGAVQGWGAWVGVRARCLVFCWGLAIVDALGGEMRGVK